MHDFSASTESNVNENFVRISWHTLPASYVQYRIYQNVFKKHDFDLG